MAETDLEQQASRTWPPAAAPDGQLVIGRGESPGGLEAEASEDDARTLHVLYDSHDER